MLGGSEGGKSWGRIRRPIEIMVEKGYSLLSLAYFREQGLPNTLEEIPLEYFEKAFAWLSASADIVPDEYAILAGSKGSEAALLLASRYSVIKAVVAFSPSSVVWQGIPKNRYDLGKGTLSSWSYKGESISFLPYPSSINKWALRTMRLCGVHEAALRDQDHVAEATIPVEAMQGAMLLISGDKDQIWPSTSMSKQIINRLKAHKFTQPYEHIALDTSHNGLLMNRACWRQIFTFLQQNFA